MAPPFSRRRFLRGGAACGLLAPGALRFLAKLPDVRADETRLGPGVVRFRPEVEPLVRLLEETPRDRLLPEVATRIRAGLGYRDLLAALLLAGVRNIQPRPVGFKFHAVLVVNSAHLASLASTGADRWLPIFWALDYFKDAQARDEREGDWAMGKAPQTRRPEPGAARRDFMQAMEDWDEERADAAVTALVRSASPGEVFDLFCRYGARDFRDLGHKAIFVANGFRALRYIGWEHAEPVARSLAYALLHHEGGSPARRDAPPDRAWRRNLGLAAPLDGGLPAGEADGSATRGLLVVLRRATAAEASDAVVERLRRRADTRPVWDALFLGAGELLMRRPGIVSLHALTTLNALHHAFESCRDVGTRRLVLLQAAAFLALFRGDEPAGDGIEIDRLEARRLDGPIGSAPDEILADVSRDPAVAAGKVLTYLRDDPGGEALMSTARRNIFLKGRDVHDYKLSSAVLEDFSAAVSAGWRDRYLAASVFRLPGSGGPDSDLVRRTREAFGSA